jgi:hypothetical protein
MRYFFLTIIIVSVNALSHATIFTVKQDGTGNFIKIQSAINIAYINDTVLVWPGTYYENLHINAKPITLASLYLTTGEKQYIYQTIIDGSTIQNSVIVADNFPTGTTGNICGFTIMNGDARYNNTNYQSQYMGWGGGILMYYADMNIVGCMIQNNLAQRDGGGIKAMYSSLYLSKTTLCNNIAYSRGGGLWFAGGISLVLDTIELNSIYLNHSIVGNDFYKHISLTMPILRVDTATTIQDHGYCILNSDSNGSPIYDIVVVANHAMIEQVNADVFVSPDGDNVNNGLTPEEPLKNIWYAMMKINPDTNNKRTVHVMPGTYSTSVTGEIYPINARSNSCLLGEDMNACILDAEQSWFHYSAHSKSYSLTIKDITFINGNSFIDDVYDYSGAINLIWSCYNILLKNILIDNCIGLKSGGSKIVTGDLMFLDNVHAINNFGGFGLAPLYFAPENRHAIFIRNCISKNNSPYQNNYGSGGGISIINSYTITMPLVSSIAGLIVANNKCRDWWGDSHYLNPLTIGAGISNITNATIGYNENENHLPGAYATWENMTSHVYNSIFYGNEHPSIILGVNTPPTGPAGELYLDYSLIEQGMDDIWNYQNYNILHYGINNIEGNPLFVGTGEHPYELQAGSPCINTGTPMYEPGMEPPYIKQENGKYILYTHGNDTIHLPETDIAGNPRIAYGRIDMGAYEFKDTTVNMKPRPQFLASGIKASPNPFQQSTAIEFTLLKEGHYIVQIHDMQGRLLKTLLDTFTQPGNLHLRWHADDDNGNKLPSGNYIINLLFEGQNVGSLKVRKW